MLSGASIAFFARLIRERNERAAPAASSTARSLRIRRTSATWSSVS